MKIIKNQAIKMQMTYKIFKIARFNYRILLQKKFLQIKMKSHCQKRKLLEIN